MNKQDIQDKGYGWELMDSWPNKATYYKPNGEAIYNLPADPRSLARYRRRGLSLTPPKEVKGE